MSSRSQGLAAGTRLVASSQRSEIIGLTDEGPVGLLQLVVSRVEAWAEKNGVAKLKFYGICHLWEQSGRAGRVERVRTWTFAGTINHLTKNNFLLLKISILGKDSEPDSINYETVDISFTKQFIANLSTWAPFQSAIKTLPSRTASSTCSV